VVVDVSEREPGGGARGHVHRHDVLRHRIEEATGDDGERRASVPHLIKLLRLRKLSERQEALREHRVGVRHVVAPRLHEGDHLEQSVFGRPHGDSPFLLSFLNEGRGLLPHVVSVAVRKTISRCVYEKQGAWKCP
jgi:hypothetical protein